jgi:Dictyostelium (slime mold) repeat
VTAHEAVAQQSIRVEPAGTVTWAELVARDALRPRGAEAPRAIPRMPAPPPRELGGGPAGAVPPGAASPVTGPPVPPSPAGPPVTASFAALGDNNTAIPPDTMGAVGPAHLMTMLNTEVRIQNKVGGIVSTVSLATFWTAGTGLTGSLFDPHVIYDSISGRWIATVGADGNSATSEIWFAISASSDPTLGWSFFFFEADAANTTWADFPGIGVNNTWIAITTNIFTVAGMPAFVGAKMWVIDKTTALAGGPLTVTVFPTSFDFEGGFGTFGSALQPAVTYSAAEPTLFIVDNTGFSSGGTPLVRLSRITGTGPAPAWSVVPGSPFAGTGLFFVANDFEFSWANAPQAGTATLIDSGDPRATPAVYRNSRLWFAHSGGLPNGASSHAATFWYQLNPAAMPAPIVQSGVLDGGAGVWHIFPSIAANAANDACIGFSRASAGIFIEAVGTSRFAGDAPGTMMLPLTVLKSGEDSYVKDFGSGSVRWGDYSATSIDPVDGSCWTIQEYSALDVGPGASDDRWGTWWTRFGSTTTTTTTTSTTTTSTTSSTTTTSTTSTMSTSTAPTPTTTTTTSTTSSTTTTSTTSTTSTSTAPTPTTTTMPTAPQCLSDASCGDGNICNGIETCRAGVCTAGTPLSCNDGDPCTVDSCAPASGCQHTMVADLASCSIVIPGGENKKSDCYVFADVAGMHPIENPKTLVCSDGDPTCDMDGKCNNVCVLQVRLCINSATLPPCTPPSQLTTLKFKSHPASFALNTPAQLTGPQCSAFNDINLPVKVSKKGKKSKKSTGVLKVTATAKAPEGTKPKTDGDTYIMKCVPGCAPS